MKGYFRNFNNNNFKPRYNNNYQKNKLDKDYKKESFIKFKNNEEKLKHISTIIENNNQTISNIIPWSETTYFTTYKNEYYFRTIGQETNTDKGNFPANVVIRKAIFSNNKIILLTELNDVNGNNGKLSVYHLIVITKNNNQNQYFSYKINYEPYDMIEDSNYIIISGVNIIYILYFHQNNNGQIILVSEIKIKKDKNNSNNNEMYKALCIEETDQNIICGHSLGYVSRWVRIQDYPYLEKKEISRIHFSSINKILYDINSDNLKVIISCSSDKTLKVHSLDDFICIKILNFNEEVIDVKKVINHKNQTNYFVNLKKGNLMLYDSKFGNMLLDIYNNSKINRNVLCLTKNINNNNNNNINAGNNNNNKKKIYVLITSENKINVYEWI